MFSKNLRPIQPIPNFGASAFALRGSKEAFAVPWPESNTSLHQLVQRVSGFSISCAVLSWVELSWVPALGNPLEVGTDGLEPSDEPDGFLMWRVGFQQHIDYQVNQSVRKLKVPVSIFHLRRFPLRSLSSPVRLKGCYALSSGLKILRSRDLPMAASTAFWILQLAFLF